MHGRYLPLVSTFHFAPDLDLDIDLRVAKVRVNKLSETIYRHSPLLGLV